MAKNPQVWHWSATLLVIIGIGLFSFYFTTQFLNPNSRLSEIALAGSYTQPVDGKCGTSATTFNAADKDFGKTTYCEEGLPSGTLTFPSPGHSSTWTCSGKNGGQKSSSCIATRTTLPPFDPNTPVPTSGKTPGPDDKAKWHLKWYGLALEGAGWGK